MAAPVKKAKAAAFDTGQIEQGIQKNIFPGPTYNTSQKITIQVLSHFFWPWTSCEIALPSYINVTP